MTTTGNCLGFVGVYYNIVIALVLAVAFMWLFKRAKGTKLYLKPWKLLFFAGITYLIEEIFVLLRTHQILDTPIYLDGFFGVIVVTFFLYMLLTQREYVETLK